MNNEIRNLDETLSSLLLELVEIDNEIAPLSARRKDIEKHLRELEPGKYTNGVFDVTVSPSTRFNKKKFEEAFPFDKYPQFYKQTSPEPDPKQIAPSVKALYSDQYDNRISIK